MKITIGELEQLFFEDSIELEEGTVLTLVESDEWVQDHKFQNKKLIFTDGEKHYSGHIERSGSPFTEWTFDSEISGEDTAAEFEEVIKVITFEEKWMPITEAPEKHPAELKLEKAINLLGEAHSLLDDVHCYDTETYHSISKFFEEN